MAAREASSTIGNKFDAGKVTRLIGEGDEFGGRSRRREVTNANGIRSARREAMVAARVPWFDALRGERRGKRRREGDQQSVEFS